jgi:hypothetical protein
MQVCKYIMQRFLYESEQRTSTNFPTDRTGTVCFRRNYSLLQTFPFYTSNLPFMSSEYTERLYRLRPRRYANRNLEERGNTF